MSKEKQFNVIIPMAGQSSRFDYSFKPFLYLDNRVFIEHVLDSFKKVNVRKYYFIIRQEQEDQNKVAETLKKRLFPHIADKIEILIIDEQTDGPFQTVKMALGRINTVSDIIICDCDHYVDTRPIIKLANNTLSDVIVPTWSINLEEHANWGKVLIQSATGKIINFYEKEIIECAEHEEVKGIIGCYYLNCSSLITGCKTNPAHFSDFLKHNHKTLTINIANILKAYFFGDPKMAKKAIEDRRKKETIICDVDGVLLKHKPCSNDLVHENVVLGDAVQKIKQWRAKDKFVVLSTARPERTRESFIAMLNALEIEYDRLVMGLNPGPRYLINDIKPSNPLVRQSLSVNLDRDFGINEVALNESEKYDLKIVKHFKGNSFSKTALMKNNNQYFVRKYILKTEEAFDHYKKLRRQLDDLQRFYYYNESLTPKILNFEDNDHAFYFDIEYLENYSQLDHFEPATALKILERVIEKLNDNVYCFKKQNSGPQFIDNFFDTKIYPKLELFEQECDTMHYLINQKEVTINNKKYLGLRNVLDKLNIYNFNTEYLSPIHGDLTLENILYNDNFKDFKLIDLDGSRYVDTFYFDLGKIFQSIVSNYKDWNSIENVVFNSDPKNLECIGDYFSCNDKYYKNICTQYAKISGVDDWRRVFRKGIFYMSMYFIRFIPFRRQINLGHGIFAMIMAVVWLNYILEEN